MRAIALTAAAAAMIMVAGCGKKDEAAANGAAGGETAAASTGSKMPKAGLWEMTVTAAGQKTPTTKVCMGATAPGANPFTPPNSGACAKNNVTATADGYDIDMECSANGQTMAMKGKVTGDMENAYTANYTMTVMGREMTTAIDAKRVGDCPAGTQPGAVVQ